jgi:hypothetical protein
LASTESPATSAPTRRSDTTLLSCRSKRLPEGIVGQVVGHRRLGHPPGTKPPKLAAEATPLAATGCMRRDEFAELGIALAAAAGAGRDRGEGQILRFSAALIRAAMPNTAGTRGGERLLLVGVLAVAASVALSTEAFWPADGLVERLHRRRCRAVILGLSAEVSALQGDVFAPGCGSPALELAAQLGDRRVRRCRRRPGAGGRGACAAGGARPRARACRDRPAARELALGGVEGAVSSTGAEGGGGGGAGGDGGPRHKVRASCGQ